MHIAIVGAGWAGLTVAVRLTQAGHAVTLFEASPLLGGRARDVALPDGRVLDNGQHIMIAAYARTLDVMRTVGVDVDAAFQRIPMTLQDKRGNGLHMHATHQHPLWAAVVALWRWRGVSWGAKIAFARWGERCKKLHTTYQRQPDKADQTVQALCAGLPLRIVRNVVEPLCVSALNTPIASASAKVFVRVLQDSLWQHAGSSDFLLPKRTLGALFPDVAWRWLQQHGATLEHQRVLSIHCVPQSGMNTWRVQHRNGTVEADAVVLACPAWEAVRIVDALLDEEGQEKGSSTNTELAEWLDVANRLDHTAIATVYVQVDALESQRHALSQPMLALPESGVNPTAAPAQFVFDRGQIGLGIKGELAFVVSDSTLPKSELETGVLSQCLALGFTGARVLKTIVEKRATFACTAGVERPVQRITAGLYAAGDWVEGEYPATLEGAVRSGENVALRFFRR